MIEIDFLFPNKKLKKKHDHINVLNSDDERARAHFFHYFYPIPRTFSQFSKPNIKSTARTATALCPRLRDILAVKIVAHIIGAHDVLVEEHNR